MRICKRGRLYYNMYIVQQNYIILEELATAAIASPVIGRRECGKILIEKNKKNFSHTKYIYESTHLYPYT